MCSTPFRCILTIINIIFGIAGIAITIVGALLIWAKPLVRQMADELMKQLGPQLQEELRGQMDEIVDVVMRMSSQIGLVVLIAGIIILVVSSLGYCGACCNNKCMLILYLIVVCVITLAHVIVVIIWFAKKDLPLGLINKVLNETVYKYESVASGTPESLMLSLFMPGFNCCGFINGSDFMCSPNFWRNDTVQGHQFKHIKYPVPCCKTIAIPSTAPSNGIFKACPQDFTSENSNIHTGCKEKVETDILPILNMIAYISLGVLGLELLIIIFTVITIKC